MPWSQPCRARTRRVLQEEETGMRSAARVLFVSAVLMSGYLLLLLGAGGTFATSLNHELRQADPTPDSTEIANIEFMLTEDGNLAAAFGTNDVAPPNPGDIELGAAIPVWGMPQTYFEYGEIVNPADLIFRAEGSWISTVTISGTLSGGLEYHNADGEWDYTTYVDSMGGHSLLTLQEGDKVVRDPFVAGYYILRDGGFVAMDGVAAAQMSSPLSAEAFVEWIRVAFPDSTPDPTSTSMVGMVAPGVASEGRPSLPATRDNTVVMGMVGLLLVVVIAAGGLVMVRR